MKRRRRRGRGKGAFVLDRVAGPVERCAACGAVLGRSEVPASDDHEAWAELALGHRARCRWVRTRAGQRPERGRGRG